MDRTRKRFIFGKGALFYLRRKGLRIMARNCNEKVYKNACLSKLKIKPTNFPLCNYLIEVTELYIFEGKSNDSWEL
jgi:hypothetical protein